MKIRKGFVSNSSSSSFILNSKSSKFINLLDFIISEKEYIEQYLNKYSWTKKYTFNDVVENAKEFDLIITTNDTDLTISNENANILEDVLLDLFNNSTKESSLISWYFESYNG